MNEVDIKFERENLAGIVAIGTYLSDAARRFGIELQNEEFEEEVFSVVKIVKGSDLLSAPTKIENELLTEQRRNQGERLAEQAKIEKAGEIIIMSTEKKVEEKPTEQETQESYRKDFEALPLQKKISSLLELEAIALSETLSFIINSPSKIVSLGMDLLAEMGLKMEDDAKKQKRPEDHQTADGEPSVKEETSEAKTGEPPPPSVIEEAEEKNPEPSVEEETAEKNPEPSVKEKKVKDKNPGVIDEPPPPSIIEGK